MKMEQFLAAAKAITPDASVIIDETHKHFQFSGSPSEVEYRIFGCMKQISNGWSVKGTNQETLLIEYKAASLKAMRAEEIRARIEAEMQDTHDAEDARNRGIYLEGDAK